MVRDKNVMPVHSGTTERTGVMRARDVREKLKGRVDPEVSKVIETLAEIAHTNMKTCVELATMFDQMLNTMQGVIQIAGNMKERTDQMKRAMEGDLEEGMPDAKPN